MRHHGVSDQRADHAADDVTPDDGFDRGDDDLLVQPVDTNAGDRPCRYRTKMVVVRQVNHLPEPCHALEHAQRLLGAEVVEGLHDVVGDKWYRWAQFGKLSVSSSP